MLFFLDQYIIWPEVTRISILVRFVLETFQLIFQISKFSICPIQSNTFSNICFLISQIWPKPEGLKSSLFNQLNFFEKSPNVFPVFWAQNFRKAQKLHLLQQHFNVMLLFELHVLEMPKKFICHCNIFFPWFEKKLKLQFSVNLTFLNEPQRFFCYSNPMFSKCPEILFVIAKFSQCSLVNLKLQFSCKILDLSNQAQKFFLFFGLKCFKRPKNYTFCSNNSVWFLKCKTLMFHINTKLYTVPLLFTFNQLQTLKP